MTGQKIAVLGGTGDLGYGLAKRWADAGFDVIVGSRKAEKAETIAAEINAEKPSRGIRGLQNSDAAREADVVAVTVPFEHQQGTLADIKSEVAGKIVIDTTVCLKPPKVGTVQLPPEGSAGIIAEETIGDVARVVSAFQNVPATELRSDGPITCHVLVTGNDKEARAEVVELIGAMGATGISAGPMANSIAVEGLTSVLITINRQFKTHAGIQITNLDGHA